ncbi:MAG: histidine phosphatase family protein, partial [Acidimicrobiales bacterium]
PGWETWREMGARVSAALDSLVERHPGETIVVACHGGVIVHSMLRYLSIDERSTDARAWFGADNTSLTEWRYAANPYRKGTLPVELVRFNDFAHLPGRSGR